MVNEDNSFVIGDDSYRMAPGYGPPFIIKNSGEMRHAVLDDTKKFCKLVQTSKALDFNSSIVVQPNDVPVATAHLEKRLAEYEKPQIDPGLERKLTNFVNFRK